MQDAQCIPAAVVMKTRRSRLLLAVHQTACRTAEPEKANHHGLCEQASLVTSRQNALKRSLKNVIGSPKC